MLDVQVLHPKHTWKGFFIYNATIVAALIVVGSLLTWRSGGDFETRKAGFIVSSRQIANPLTEADYSRKVGMAMQIPGASPSSMVAVGNPGFRVLIWERLRKPFWMSYLASVEFEARGWPAT